MVCGFHYQRLVFELVEICLDLLVAGFGLRFDRRQRAGQGNLLAFAFLAGHQPLHVLRLGGLDPVAARGLEKNPRVTQRDGLVAVIGDDQPHRHHAMAKIVDAKDGFLFLRVVGLGGDGHIFFVVDLDGGETWSRAAPAGLVIAGASRERETQSPEANRLQTTFIVLDCII